MIEKEVEQEEMRAKSGGSSSRGKKRVIEEVQKADKAGKISRSSTPASAGGSAANVTKRPSKKKKT